MTREKIDTIYSKVGALGLFDLDYIGPLCEALIAAMDENERLSKIIKQHRDADPEALLRRIEEEE